MMNRIINKKRTIEVVAIQYHFDTRFEDKTGNYSNLIHRNIDILNNIWINGEFPRSEYVLPRKPVGIRKRGMKYSYFGGLFNQTVGNILIGFQIDFCTAVNYILFIGRIAEFLQ